MGGFSCDISVGSSSALTVIEHVTRTRPSPIIPASASTSIMSGIATSTIGQMMVVTLPVIIVGSIGVIAVVT